MTRRPVLGSMSSKRYVPAGSVMPGIDTGPLNVRYVSLFHSSAWAAGDRLSASTAAPHAILHVRMRSPSSLNRVTPEFLQVVCPDCVVQLAWDELERRLFCTAWPGRREPAALACALHLERPARGPHPKICRNPARSCRGRRADVL